MSENTAVVVLGGGYAGVKAANLLARRADVTVTLVNPRPDFVERIRLHQLVGGSHDAVHDFREVLAGRVRLVVDTATRIDATDRTITLAAGLPLGYDYLVYAVGSGSAHQQVPGAAEFSYSIAGLEDARRLRPVLAAAPADAAITVVGAGPTGIETAAELAELGRAVTLVCGRDLGPSLHPRVRRAVARRLAGLGVTVLAGPDTTVTAVTETAVRLRDGRELSSAITIWTAGFAVPDLAARSGLSTDDLGRLATDETLTSVDDPHIIGAGDSATSAYRMSCQSASQLGPRAAKTVLARIDGNRPGPAKVYFAGTCMSLGRDLGVFQVAQLDDTSRRVHVGGRTASKLKEKVCVETVGQLVRGARKAPAEERTEPVTGPGAGVAA